MLLFSLQRSGSNYIEQSLLRMTRINDLSIENSNQRGHYLQKHFRPYSDASITSATRYPHLNTLSDEHVRAAIERMDVGLVILRHPLAWIRSYRQFGKVCRPRWPVYDDNHYAREWITYVSTWASQMPANCQFISYEQVILSEGKLLCDILESLGINPKKQVGFISRVPLSKAYKRDKLIETIQCPPTLREFHLSSSIAEDLVHAASKYGMYIVE